MLLFRFHHGEYSSVDIDLVISSCTQKKSTLSASMTMNELLVRLYNVEVRVPRRKRTSLVKSARFFGRSSDVHSFFQATHELEKSSQAGLLI